MKTAKELQARANPDFLRAIERGTATPAMREAYRLQLVASSNEPLLAADLTVQTDFLVVDRFDPRGQGQLFA